jgi:Ca2+-binding RTX toxin-like protein
VGVGGNNNRLLGGSGNDYLAASGNGNTLDGGPGSDHLVAGAGHQSMTFLFQLGYGQDDVTGFLAHIAGGSDVINLQGYGLTFANLINLYTKQVGTDCVIDFKNGDVLTLHDVQKSGLQAGDFVL